jgi:Secretion system C-terminal sorting domain
VNSSSAVQFKAVPTPYQYGITAPTGPFAPDVLNGTVNPGYPAINDPTGFVSNAPNFPALYSVPNGAWTLAMADGGGGDFGTLSSWTLSFTYGTPSGGIWTPNGAGSGLYTDAAATTVYTGTVLQTVYARPAVSTTYSVTVNTGTCTSPARLVPVTVNTPVAITAQSGNQVICTDKTATFSVTVTGTSPGYQWQVSTNGGGTWNNISNGGVYSGATTATLTITNPPVTMSGNLYRVIVGGAPPCGNVTSASRSLTVNPLPTVVISASPYTALFPGLFTTLSSTVTPNPAATYTWFRNGIIVGGATTGTLNLDVDALGDYQLLVTDVNGCTNISNKVTIRDSVTTNCFLYPNPSNGKFQVRYHSVAGNVLPRTVTVYDSRGTRVFTQAFTVTAPYARMDVDLRAMGHGVYWVEIGDLNGNRISICRAVVQ